MTLLDPAEVTVGDHVSAPTPTVVPELPVTEAGPLLTAANYSEGSAATIEALRPTELFPPDVEDPWTSPRTHTTPALPPALRKVPTHGPQFKRQIVRRQTPKTNFALFVLLFASVFVVFARVTSDRQTPLNYFLSIVWSIYAPLIVIGLVGALYLRTQQSRGRKTKRQQSHGDDIGYRCSMLG